MDTKSKGDELKSKIAEYSDNLVKYNKNIDQFSKAKAKANETAVTGFDLFLKNHFSMWEPYQNTALLNDLIKHMEEDYKKGSYSVDYQKKFRNNLEFYDTVKICIDRLERFENEIFKKGLGNDKCLMCDGSAERYVEEYKCNGCGVSHNYYNDDFAVFKKLQPDFKCESYFCVVYCCFHCNKILNHDDKRGENID